MILMLVMMLPILVMSSCSEDESNSDTNSKEDPISVVGTWENGKYFISFGEDGFYCSYLGDKFIDSGNYKLSGTEITCSNAYFNRETSFSVLDATATQISVKIKYVDLSGNNNSKSMVLTKCNIEPASKENPLIGRSISWNTYDTFGIISMNFNTYNSGVKTASRGSAKNYPLDFYYIYIGNRMYYQILKNSSIQVPSIGGWSTNYGDVSCWEITISPDGNIGFQSINI